jgi:hypothetical protein
MFYVVGLGILALIILNVVVSLRAVRDEFSSSLQKTVQILLVWLLPFLGAFIAWRLLSTSLEAPSKSALNTTHGLAGNEYVTFESGGGDSANGAGD